jgi:hypothetical protein
MGNPVPTARQVITEEIRNLDKTEGREEGIAKQRRKGIRHKKVILSVRCYWEDGEIRRT